MIRLHITWINGDEQTKEFENYAGLDWWLYYNEIYLEKWETERPRVME